MYWGPSGAKETVEQLILRCSALAVSRRQHSGRTGSKTVEEVCRENRLQVLRFLDDEKLLERNVTL